MTDRLQQLEQQAAAILSEIAVLKAGKAAPPPPPPRDELRIVQLNNEITAGLPDLRQMEKLYSVVRNLSPWPEMLRDKYDDGRPFRAFSSTFRWVMNVPRSDRPNGKVALSYWLDTCRTWLRARNAMASDLDVNALVLACLAAGDVCYCAGNPSLGVVWEIGILEFGGKPADPAGWRRILKEGAAAVLPPSSPARRMPAPSNVRVVVGSGY